MAKVNPAGNDRTQPFVKWAGGKRQLIPAISERLPERWGSYYEPFIGGGAILMHFNPERATINDINSELIHAYRTIRDNPLEFCVGMLGLGELLCRKRRQLTACGNPPYLSLS